MQELTALILPDIQTLLADVPPPPEVQAHLRDLVAELHPADVADLIENLDPEPAANFFSCLQNGSQREVFDYLPESSQLELIERLGPRRMVPVIEAMSSDERADLVKALPEQTVQRLLPLVAQAERNDILRLVKYEEGTAGAVMSSEYASLPADLMVRQALDRLRQVAPNRETIYYVYITDEERRLRGVISLQELILAQPEKRLEELMHANPIHVHVEDPEEDVAQTLAHYDFIAVPVVDDQHRLMGIVTYDDAMDVAESEATEGFHKAGGSLALGDVGPEEAPVSLLFRKRVFWLLILVFGNLFSAAGIAHFEQTIAAYVALVFYLPLLIDSGGNAGSQAATLMVRALATGSVCLRDWGRLLAREFAVSGLLGLAMAMAVASIGAVRSGPQISLIVASSMATIVVIGSIVGMSLPFLLSRLGLDPASASAPLVTSICDALGVLIYLSIAVAVLGAPSPGP